MNSVFASSILPELITELPLIQFNGKIIVVDNVKSMPGAIKFLNNHSMIGFDTESKPSFRKGQINKVSLLQLAYYDTCFIFRLNKIGFGDDLIHLLNNSLIKKIGLSLKDDFRELSKLSHFQPSGFIELQKYVENFNITDKSLKKLVALILGHRISKSQQTSNWESENLTEAQIIYAATDAWACLEIYKRLVEIENINGKSNYSHS
jgi:ribonuclease D